MSYLKVDPSMSGDDDSAKENDLEVDNSKSLLAKIAALYAEQLMSDLVLVVGGVSYTAHRLILCANSEVFQVMLMNREWSEWRESRVVLQETPDAASVFPLFLKYFYTGQISLSQNTVLPVLSLADKYNVKDLTSLCLCFMSQNTAQAAKCGQIVGWMQYTMACGHHRVALLCQNYLKWNLESICLDKEGGGGFQDMERDTLVALLQENDLVVTNEITVYKIVILWLEHQKEKLCNLGYTDEEAKLYWECTVETVLTHVRFPMMCPNQLANLLLSPFIQEFKDFLLDRMATAMSYQSGKYVINCGNLSECRRQFTPRLYTDDSWGSVLNVDNFHSLPCYHTRTFIFMTRPMLSDAATPDKNTEWLIDLYPKGVWFKKSMVILWSGTYDIPETVLRTVRISITCQNPPESVINEYGEVIQQDPDIRVKIGILVWGVQKGVEYITSVVEKVHRFSAQYRVLNIDGALDFDELNTPLYVPHSPPTIPTDKRDHLRNYGRCVNCNGGCNIADESHHLLGPNGDQLRLQVVIVPLTEQCHVTPDEAHG